VVEAGLQNLAPESLSNFDGFGDTTPSGYQARQIRTRGHIAALFERLDAQPDGHFFHLRDAFVASATVFPRSSHDLRFYQGCGDDGVKGQWLGVSGKWRVTGDEE
jgi:hypothetical protein